MEKDLKKIYLEQLFEKAIENHIIDVSENSLICNFQSNYEFYATILEESMADGVISVKDKVNLYKYRAKIVLDDFKLIQQMENPTEKDYSILREILKIVNNLKIQEQSLPSLV